MTRALMILAMGFGASVARAAPTADPGEPSGPAEVEQGAPGSVALQVFVIGASMKGSTDPALASWRRRLEAYRYTAYRILDRRPLRLHLNSRETIALPGGRSLEIRPRKFEKSGLLRLHVHLFGPTQVKLVCADYAIAPGGDLTVGGPKLENGDALFILIRHGA